MESKKDIILANAKDLARDFLYYDRKEDEDLKVNEIQYHVKVGTVTKEDIVKAFSDELNEWWE